jgi:oligopeptide transport system substrate-binding protein
MWFYSIFLIVACLSCSNDKTKNSSTLNVAVSDDPISLDPRLVRDLSSSSIMRILYEGLMRSTYDGKIIPGIADSYTVSEDQKTYTFHLRPCQWSDGSALTADDIAETWKTVLAPNFPAPNAYQLYLIKGAKKAKEGQLPSNEIGIKTVGVDTLIVELEQPAPYFIEMISCHFFFPVHKSLRDQKESDANMAIGNGPFQLERWKKRDEINFVKNPHYWDEKNTHLKELSLHVLDEHTALQLFKADELNWAGSPLSTLPQDAVAPLKDQKQLQISPGAGTHWFRLNITKTPFNKHKIRRAFAMALNRQDIIEHITQGNQLPALGIVPPSFGLPDDFGYIDHDLEGARALFNEALVDASIEKKDFPVVYLSYAANDRNHKIAQAVQQQWNQAFDIKIGLDSNESHVQMDKLKKGEYDMALGSWYADIEDPINFLEIFKYKDNPSNQTFWQNNAYTELLDQSSLELDLEKRAHLLAEAQKILMEGMPVIPIFHSSYNYLKSPNVHGVYFSPLGFVDFKEAGKQE